MRLHHPLIGYPGLRNLLSLTILLGMAGNSLAAVTAPSIPPQTAAQAAAPKLVVVLVVDGLPQEQILRYRDQFGAGGFRRLLAESAWFSNAHQAHGVTVTAVGHAAVLSGAYPYQHGVIANDWIDKTTLASVYCTEDARYTYLGNETAAHAGTAPTNLHASTVGDELRYASGNRAKVITVSGKDRGAILLAGKSGTAYMYMGKSGEFASSTYYMQQHPTWVQQYLAGKPQDAYYGKTWQMLLPPAAYANDAADEIVDAPSRAAPLAYDSRSGHPDAEYYGKLGTGPYLDELTLKFARAAIEGENLGRNPAGVPDVLGVSLSSHDYVNHAYGPESRLSHDHLQRLDRMLADFFNYLDSRVGLANTLVVLTADHGFPNVPEYAQALQRDTGRIDSKAMQTALEKHLSGRFGVDGLVRKWSAPVFLLDQNLIEQKHLPAAEVETAATHFLESYPGLAYAYSRHQLENGQLPANRIAKLMQRAWNSQISGDIMVVAKPNWIFGSGRHGTTHGSPYSYDTNVPLMLMGANWIKPGYYGDYAEVVDIAPTLSHLLQLRPPSASEGRVLSEVLSTSLRRP
ncbi:MULTISPECIES: alkaline phosphatase family protein [unclassified Undibacterium]|uniref:alkaline phosphatase family protein n=1 Tax=unclassified Undibacterium TaxID=2630295 RepID=UPI002AC9CAAA|nr:MULTISPECIES: alkaline phosphatase family protein [unclassified Undibacterium]MEB0139286.1 alkaline phosphatase family protein [Undibacterium sp. CCC2.1]MEB0172130.1 alkaline phosphatase family protein [Undibacterium sp. CCC1.1]MEB0176005.1 alkaline phosphatase family protein [Undibacterium sp. CCC3.4]MEB0215317.1 alkaline phosphatase family protein [Undibacterium sp. 5I2]WPX45490.1 alkaline phosphatase family protein [Undibacterium sp. CCC3.4]